MLVLLVAVGLPPRGPVEAATPKNTVVVAMGGDYFDGIDPVTSGFFVSNEFQILTHERLVDYVHVTLPDGRKVADPEQPTGGLAESFQLSPDKKSFTFRLRRGHRFANGDPITAHAVKYSFNRMLHVPGIGKFGLTRVLRIEAPEQMVVVDDHTIRFDLKDPNPIFALALTLNNFGIINPKEVETRKTEKDPQAREWMKVNSTGSGPYVLEAWKPGTELVFRANPHYHRGKPAVERVIYKVVPSEQDRILLLKNGDVDAAYNLSERNVVQLKTDPAISVQSFETVGKEFLFMNPALKPFTDVRVRQAVNHAINKDTIVKSVFMGLAVPLSSPIPKGMAYHKPLPAYPHDLEKAKRLLAEAGYPGGFTIELAYRIGYPAHEEAAVYVQADLAKVGITVKPEKVPPATFTERARKNQLPFGFSNFVPYVNHPAYHTYWQYHGESGFNWSRFNDPAVNELINRAQVELAPDAQRDLFTRIQDTVYTASPEVLLVQPLFNAVTRKGLRGYVFYPDRLARWDLVAKD
jgi:peptide/nickel transport system substrate-binding protein